MKAKFKFILALILVAACVSWSAFSISQRRSASANKTRHLTAMSRLNDVIREGLQDYYHTNGRYPDKLTGLAVALPNDAKPEILDSFLYTTSGAYYIVTWGLQWSDEPLQMHKEHAAKGKVVFIEEYVDEEMCSRTEYPNGFQDHDTRVEKEYRDGRLVSTTEYKNGRKVSEETPTRQP